MTVYERFREIGSIRAVGIIARRRDRAFIPEGAMIVAARWVQSARRCRRCPAPGVERPAHHAAAAADPDHWPPAPRPVPPGCEIGLAILAATGLAVSRINLSRAEGRARRHRERLSVRHRKGP